MTTPKNTTAPTVEAEAVSVKDHGTTRGQEEATTNPAAAQAQTEPAFDSMTPEEIAEWEQSALECLQKSDSSTQNTLFALEAYVLEWRTKAEAQRKRLVSRMKEAAAIRQQKRYGLKNAKVQMQKSGLVRLSVEATPAILELLSAERRTLGLKKEEAFLSMLADLLHREEERLGLSPKIRTAKA